MIDVVSDDETREVDAVLAIAVQVIGFAVLGVAAGCGVVAGLVFGLRAGWRKLTRIRGW
jgi:predicted benzoate:H+ symporter BenE